MLNNKHLRALFIKVMAVSFILTLLLAAPYISRKAPELLQSLAQKGQPENNQESTQTNIPTEASNGELEELMATRKASGKQVKPSFDTMPVELFPSNQAFALDFHKLPVDYLVPQQPEVTRTAAALIKQHKDAELKATREQQAIAAGQAGLTSGQQAETATGGL